MTKEIWGAWGSVRGWCGHRHRSQEAAQRCADRDTRQCALATQGGYSDRGPRRIEDIASLRRARL